MHSSYYTPTTHNYKVQPISNQLRILEFMLTYCTSQVDIAIQPIHCVIGNGENHMRYKGQRSALKLFTHLAKYSCHTSHIGGT